MNHIEKELNIIIKESMFKSWTKLQSKFGYSDTGRASLKQKIRRITDFMNNILRPLGYELTIKKIKNDMD
jgi:hypothetical protein